MKLCKAVVVGDVAVGKTSFVNRLVLLYLLFGLCKVFFYLLYIMIYQVLQSNGSVNVF